MPQLTVQLLHKLSASLVLSNRAPEVFGDSYYCCAAQRNSLARHYCVPLPVKEVNVAAGPVVNVRHLGFLSACGKLFPTQKTLRANTVSDGESALRPNSR